MGTNVIYTNGFTVAGNQFEVMIKFLLETPSFGETEKTDINEVADIRMSPSAAKLLIASLQKIVEGEQYAE